MKIAMIGAGGVGGYYGGLLAQQGEQVTFLARGAHLQALQERGLQVKSIHGDFNLHPVRAVSSLSAAGPQDLVVFCVKTYDTARLAQEILPVLGDETMVLSLQNGIDAAEQIGAVVGMPRMLAGATWISSAIQAPGLIQQVSQFRRVVLGELDGSFSPRLQAVYRVFEKTGITLELSQDIRKVLWTKFVFISAVSSLGSLTRLALGDYRAVPETRAIMAGLMGEVEAIARAAGIGLEADVVEKTLAFIDQAAAGLRGSMQNDIQAGRRTELESMIGVIGRMGRRLSVPTPVADLVYAALLPVDLKAQGIGDRD